jgi:hypothetical protein
MAKKARKAKAATKKKSAKASAKKAGKKSAVKKKASAKKARVGKAKKVAKKALDANGASPALGMRTRAAGAAAVPPDNNAKLLAVGKYVNNFMNDENQPWSDSDLVTKFGYTLVSIAGVLGVIRAALTKNLPQSYTLTITPTLKAKCVSSAETVGQMKIDINGATV